MKSIAILGSTGSIGRQTIDVVRAFPEYFKIIGLAAGTNTRLLAKQISDWQPLLVNSLRPIELPRRVKVVSLEDIAAYPDVDIVVIATAGKTGLGPTLAALRAGKTVALANKEALVMAGHLVMAEARKHGGSIRPVDSEHSAVWQCLLGERSPIKRLYLTASGGPFYGYSPQQLRAVTPEQALRHPTWRMGKKVTVDSATLMNKGLEVIEAHWLFGIPINNIKVLVHRQSIVHALVEFADGSVKAQLGLADMRLPIQFALSYPKRLHNTEIPRLDLDVTGSLKFEAPNIRNFPCLELAIKAGQTGGTHPAVLCAADEIAVELFLKNKVGFTDIAHIVYRTLEQHEGIVKPDLGDILQVDSWARETALKAAQEVRECS